MVTLVITVIVVIILSTIVVTSSNKSLNQAAEAQMQQQMAEVKKGVDTVRLANAKTGKTDEETINAGFIKVRVVNPPETFVSFDEDQLTGYAVDLSVIDYQKLEIGRDYLSLMKGDIVTFDEDDVFLYDNAGKVYYAKGYVIGDGDVSYTASAEERKEPPKIEVISTTGGLIKLKITPVYGGEISSVLVGTKHATTSDGLNFEVSVNKNGSYKVVATEEGGNSGVLMVEVADLSETPAGASEIKDVYINNKEKYTNKQLAVLHVEADNATHMSISQDGFVAPNVTDLAKWRTYQAQTNITLKEGLNRVYVWCKNADNSLSAYKYTEVTLDSIAPTRDAPSFVMNGFQILATCNQRDETSDELTIQYGYKRVDETEYRWQDSQIIVDVDPGVKYMLVTKATDMAGNTSESRSIVTDEILTIPDNITITATPATGWTTRVTVDIEYPGTHGVSPFENLYRVDGGEWKKATSNRVSMTVIKNSKIEAVVSANLNGQDIKMGNIKVLNVKNIDRVDPYIHDVEYVTGYVQEGYDVKAKVYDKESGLVAWTVTNDRVQPTTWANEFANTKDTVQISYRIEQNGVYYIWAKDEGGNVGYIGIEVDNIDLQDPIINSLTVSYGVGEATLTAKAIDSSLGLAAYAFVKGQNATPTASAWTTIEKTTTEYTMTGKATANDYYTIWVKDVSGRTASQSIQVKVKYNVTYQYYEINDSAQNTTLKSETVVVGCNSNVDLSKTGTRKYSTFVGWNTDPNATTKMDSLKLGDPTTGQEDITLYGIFKYKDTISFSSSNTSRTYELNLTISKVTPFTTLQYSTDNKTWTNYTKALYITSNGVIYARTTYNNAVIATNSFTISNICENHVWSNATCTAESRCTLCNKYNGPALGHDMGTDWYTTVAATCTTDGTERNDCIRYNQCGKYETRTVTKYGHSYGDYVVTTEPTCTDTGVKEKKCSKCGDVQTASVDAPGHSWGTSSKKATSATCTKAATYYYQCSKCSAYASSTYSSGSAKGHSFTSYTTTKAATCTAAGTKTAYCDNGCGTKDTKSISKKGHSYTSYTTTKSPTCTAAGSKIAYCNNGCGTTNTQSIPANGHTIHTQLIGAVAYNVCSKCDYKEFLGGGGGT